MFTFVDECFLKCSIQLRFKRYKNFAPMQQSYFDFNTKGDYVIRLAGLLNGILMIMSESRVLCNKLAIGSQICP